MIVCNNVFDEKIEVKKEDLTLGVAVYGIIIEDGKILLTQQWDGYSLPGGGTKLGETLAETFTREVEEETGLVVEIGDIIHSETCFYNHKNKVFYHAVTLFYTHKSLNGEISLNNLTESEKQYVAGKAEWIAIDKLDTILFRHSCDLKMILKKNNFYK